MCTMHAVLGSSTRASRDGPGKALVGSRASGLGGGPALGAPCSVGCGSAPKATLHMLEHLDSTESES